MCARERHILCDLGLDLLSDEHVVRWNGLEPRARPHCRCWAARQEGLRKQAEHENIMEHVQPALDCRWVMMQAPLQALCTCNRSSEFHPSCIHFALQAFFYLPSLLQQVLERLEKRLNKRAAGGDFLRFDEGSQQGYGSVWQAT